MPTPERNKSIEDNIKKIRSDLDKLDTLIKSLDDAGISSESLKKVRKRLTFAVEQGVNLAEAALESSRAIDEHVHMLRAQCRGDVMCEVEIDRQWQKRSVDFTLSWQNKNSVIRNFVGKVICDLLPMTDNLKMCAKQISK